MKNSKYYGPYYEYEFVVLAKGFKPFCTDSEREARADAAVKATVSDRVTVLDDDVAIVEYRYGKVYDTIHN